MANVISMGVHRPPGLQYLAVENIHNQGLDGSQYDWTIYDDSDMDIEEEILVTDDAVIYSRDGCVQRVFKFNSEVESVRSTLLTNFPNFRNRPNESPSFFTLAPDLENTGRSKTKSSRRYRSSVFGSRAQSESQDRIHAYKGGVQNDQSLDDRALAIFLDRQAQIHFLSGSSYLVNLPFEIERAFAAPDGLIVQRRVLAKQPTVDSPEGPKVPPNSFLTSQAQTSVYHKSPLAPKRSPLSFSLDRPSSQGRVLGKTVDEIFRSPITDNTEDSPSMYTLTDPLNEFCAISQATLAEQSRHTRQPQAGLLVEYDDLDKSESIVYISPKDELQRPLSAQRQIPLLLVVTINHDLEQITLWQAWYIQAQSLSALMAARAALRASKARRRSSFVSAAPTTGVTTPLVRPRERARESFATSARLPTEQAMSGRRGQRQDKKRTEDEDEAAMASQMDPDFQASQNQNRGSKRVSSLLSRGDLSTADPVRGHIGANISYGGQGKRGPSFGAAQDRRSFGASIYRKSRGSTPGSVFSRSIGPDDDSMDLDEDTDLDETESEISQIQQLFLATQTSAGVDAALGCTTEVTKQELVLRKLYTMPMLRPSSRSDASARVAPPLKVCTLLKAQQTDQDRRTLAVSVLDRAAQHMTLIDLSVAVRWSRPHSRTASKLTFLPVPLIMGKSSTTESNDAVKITQGSLEAILTLRSDNSLLVMPQTGIPWSVSLPQTVRVFDPTDMRITLSQDERDVGKNRNVELELGGTLQKSGLNGQLDVTDSNGTRHRMKVLLRPRDSQVSKILDTCRFVLGGAEGESILRLWISAYHFQQAQPGSTASDDAEWEALIMTMFSFTVGSMGATAGKQRTSRTPRRRPRRDTHDLDPSPDHVTAVQKSSAWAWMSNIGKPVRPVQRRSINNLKGSDARNMRTIPSMTELEASTRRLLHHVAVDGMEWLLAPDAEGTRTTCSLKILFAVHVYREEMKLLIPSKRYHRTRSDLLAAALAQLGHWLQLETWSPIRGGYFETKGATAGWDFSDSVSTGPSYELFAPYHTPYSIYAWVEDSLMGDTALEYVTLEGIAALGSQMGDQATLTQTASHLLPRTSAVRRLVHLLDGLRSDPTQTIQALVTYGFDYSMIESLPSSITAPLRNAIATCQRHPAPEWPPELLQLVNRDDLVDALRSPSASLWHPSHRNGNAAATDIHSAFATAERMPLLARTHQADRHAVIQQIFTEDRRYIEASKLNSPAAVQVAECPPQPEWTEVEHLEQQKRVMQWVMTRTMALSPGDAMVHFESQKPLLSEKFHVAGFSTLCQMKPMDNTISADRSGFTEEKLNWAFFHAGVSAGLHISRYATGIDTSWIVFNKPADLTNRHAGFLFALGLNGHLRILAKWLAFKYLTPKHTMTSVGLLLGLSASYIGTMDSLITRMLSVHITRMLPPGAAELNVSSLTQTAGLMGIGLLYHDTQHRRMSEIMLSEIEHQEGEESGTSPESVRDESYRLAAGFALGLINIGKGQNLQGLHGMDLLERLLSVAIGPRPVDIVHVVDKAVAGAVMAIAFIYMKTGDAAVARKIDVPQTIAQLDHVRPDILLLRTVAKNLILWDQISAEAGWIRKSLPNECAIQYFGKPGKDKVPQLRSDYIPVFNIVAGLAWSLSLKYAGSGNVKARDEVLIYLRLFTTVSKQDAYYYDALLARNTVKRCIDILALSAATIMAGTGDIETFRYLRRLHGRTDSSTTYGSHLAAHLAIGTLFLGGGTYTFGTSNLAIASLVCAFYPVYPSDVLDNAVHLQALRHFWVFAAEARCIVVHDIDTQRPISLDLQLWLRDGTTKSIKAPCLLPEFQSIARISTNDPTFWPVTLDFVANPKHLAAFLQNQTMHVRRAPAQVASPLIFNSTLTTLNEAQSTPPWHQMWEWIMQLPTFKDLDADLGLVIPPIAHSNVHLDGKGTVADTRLALMRAARSSNKDELWDLRVLFQWARVARDQGYETSTWLPASFVDRLKTEIERRITEAASL